jgi:hypothetical protein
MDVCSPIGGVSGCAVPKPPVSTVIEASLDSWSGLGVAVENSSAWEDMTSGSTERGISASRPFPGTPGLGTGFHSGFTGDTKRLSAR